MTIEAFRNLYHTEPFQPFVIHLADGRAIPVHRRDLIALAPSGRAVAAYQPDDTMDVIDLLLVTDLEIQPAGNSSGRPRKG